MTDPSAQPWLNLYRSVPPTIQPKAKTALEMFQDTLAERPDEPIVHYFDKSLTAAEVDKASTALAAAFRDFDIRHGDRIAMYLQNIPQVMITVLAAWKRGAVIVPCNPMLRDKELAKILRASGCRDSWDRATTGTSRSMARRLSPREISATSCWRESTRRCDCMSWR